MDEATAICPQHDSSEHFKCNSKPIRSNRYKRLGLVLARLAILSMIGTLGGSLCGILVANKLSNYRILQLEKKVDKHNNFAQRLPVVEEQIKVIKEKIDDLEKAK